MLFIIVDQEMGAEYWLRGEITDHGISGRETECQDLWENGFSILAIPSLESEPLEFENGKWITAREWIFDV